MKPKTRDAIISVFITGANGSIGKRTAKLLAQDPTIERIVLSVRSLEKGEALKADLEADTGRNLFEVFVLDVADTDGVKSKIQSIEPIDALIMNAGGLGGDAPFETNAKGVTNMVSSNLLGHFVLAEELIKDRRVNKVVMFSGSEAARGIPKMGVQRPTLPNSSIEDFIKIIDGTFFETQDAPQYYGYVKYMGSLWIGSLARRNPGLRIFSVSPGATTEMTAVKTAPWIVRLFLKAIGLRILIALGLLHDPAKGAERYVRSLKDTSFGLGKFYASKENRTTGDLVDQSTFFPNLNNETFQDNAYSALSQFV